MLIGSQPSIHSTFFPDNQLHSIHYCNTIHIMYASNCICDLIFSPNVSFKTRGKMLSAVIIVISHTEYVAYCNILVCGL